MFPVVHFLASDEVSPISHKWLISEELCKWPPVVNPMAVKKCMLLHQVPDDNWKAYHIHVMGRYDNYATAKKKAAKALDTSNLESELSSLERSPPPHKRKRVAERHQDLPSENEAESLANKKLKNVAGAPSVSDDESPSDFGFFCSTPNVNINAEAGNSDFSTPVNSSTQNVTVNAEAGNSGSSTLVNTSRPAEFPAQNFDTLDLIVKGSEPTPFEVQIMKKLDALTTVMTNLVNMVASLKGNTVPFNIPNMPKLPIDNAVDLKEWESFIENADNFARTVKYFGCHASHDVSTSVRRILSEIITNNFAQNYNWCGKPLKQAFKNLKTVTMIIFAVREHPLMKEAPSKIIEDVIKDWLKHATFREKYQKKSTFKIKFDIK